MSLGVHVYFHNDDGERRFVRSVDWKSLGHQWQSMGLTPKEMLSESMRHRWENEMWRHKAGPEVWRTQVYGSEFALSLGLSLLPTLAKKDLDVTGSDLNRLQAEAELLIQRADELAVETKRTRDEIMSPLRNIAAAAAEAKDLAGGVVIW